MRYQELFEALAQRYDLKSVIRQGGERAIFDVRLIQPGNAMWEHNTVYFGDPSLTEIPSDRPLMLVVTAEPPPLAPGSSCVRIDTAELAVIFNAAKDLIFEELRNDGIFFELTQIVDQSRDFTAVMNAAARIMGNALVLIDGGLKVLASSTIYEIADPLWAENIKRGYASTRFMNMVRLNSDMRSWKKEGSSLQSITLDGDSQPKLVTKVIENGHIAGALVMIAHHTPIDRRHSRQLPLLSKTLYEAYTRLFFHETANSRLTPHSRLLYELLDADETLPLLKRSADAGLTFPPVMRVVVARYMQRVDNRYLKSSFIALLHEIFPEGYSVQYKGYMSILVQAVTEAQLASLEALAQREEVRIGISWQFFDPGDYPAHFNQAVTAIKLAEHFNDPAAVLKYHDYLLPSLLRSYVGDVPLEEFCHPAIKKLRSYDEAKGTDFLRTLRCYLDAEQNMKRCAERLFIHRNTLHYRLENIKKLLGQADYDEAYMFSLRISFAIDDFLSHGRKPTP